jgi:UDP-N-acetylmuramoyl-L-alanyl-D-glutamate--2,6-diaminopimelate ligase
MKLKMLLKGLSEIEVRGSKEVEITGVSSDSRTVAPGNLFIAKKGSVHDGSQFISQAISSGAAAIVSDFYDPFLKKTQLITKTPTLWEAELASRYYHHPSKDLLVVGVTGTKGKTTTTYLIQHLLEGMKKKCGLVGTVETVIGDHRFASSLTTHDVIYNQKILREMVLKQCEAVAFEVSSHGLIQGRVDKIDFDIGVFTNLYRDHLDYHQTMEEYASAKKKLFVSAKKNIVNLDSPWSSLMKGEKEALTFGIENKADVMGSDIQFDQNKTTFWVEFDGKREKFTSSLIGRFNVYNLLAAICVGVQLGEPLEKISSYLASFGSVPGRLQLVSSESEIKVFVDHAHTEEALDSALQAVRAIAEKRVLLVFGCGGNRDPARRVGMARAAERWADLVIVTNDNPRREAPQEICDQILSGFKNIEKVVVELDRKSAIHHAISIAAAGDVVLVAGKGHEKVQIFAHQTISFDDVAIVKEALGLTMESI